MNQIKPQKSFWHKFQITILLLFLVACSHLDSATIETVNAPSSESSLSLTTELPSETRTIPITTIATPVSLPTIIQETTLTPSTTLQISTPQISTATPNTFTSFETQTPFPTVIPAISSFPFPLPAEAVSILVYVVVSPVPYAPPSGQLFFIPLDIENNPLSPAQPWLETGDVSGLYVSPNGKFLAIVTEGLNGTFPHVIDLETGETFSNGSSNRPGSFEGWATDSSGVLRSGETPDDSISLVNSESYPLVEDSSNYTWVFGATTSPDGRYLVYSKAGQSGMRGTWQKDLITGAETLLFNYSIFVPSWSPTGSWIAYVERSTLNIMRSGGSEVKTITDKFAFGHSYFLSWSFQGDGLTYMANIVSPTATPQSMIETEYSYNAYIVDIQDENIGEPRPVVAGSSSGYIDPSWTPNGDALLVIGGYLNTADVWLVSRDGQTSQQLTFDGGYKRHPVLIQFIRP